MKSARLLFVAAVGLAAFASAAEEPFFRTFFRNEENAAIRLKVKMPAAGEYALASSFAGERLPERTVALPAGDGELAVPIDPSQVRPGAYPYSFELKAKDGKIVLAQSGEVRVRGRLERDEMLFHSWGGWSYIHHDFGEMIGINSYNIISSNKDEVRRIIDDGAHPNIRYENPKAWQELDFDWAAVRAKAKKDLAYAAGQHAWVSTLLNSEDYGAGMAQAAKDNPKYLALVRRDLGFEPEFTYKNDPSEVDWKKLGMEPPRGMIGHDRSPTLETLAWVMAKGMPIFFANRETAKAIHELQPGNLVWSEPLWGGVADAVDMGADWIYKYSTLDTLCELAAQYAGSRAFGRPYMPTLGASYWPRQMGRHPTLLGKDGKPLPVEVAQGADEVIVKTWLSMGAVPMHHLSFFILDSWEYGVSNALKFAASPTNAQFKIVSEPDVGVRYGKAWHRDLGPAAQLLRDMPNEQADVALLYLPEIEFAAGFWWGHYHYSCAIRGVLGACAPSFDVVGEPEATVGKLSKYKYVVLPMARVVYRDHAETLRKVAERGTVIVQDSYATNHYPNEVWLKDLRYTPEKWNVMGDTFRGWFTNQVDGLRARAFAASDADGEKGFTFVKEYKGAKYVVVVNDARDPKPSFLNQFKTNDWYRVVGAPQRIKTAVKCADDATVYLFNGHGREFSVEKKDDRRVLTGEYGPAEGRVYCVYPKPLKGPALTLEGEAKPCAKATLVVRIDDADGKPAPGRQVVELKLVDDTGAVRDESGLYVVEDGVVRITVRFARDDRPKGWTATVTDLTTGKAAAVSVGLGAFAAKEEPLVRFGVASDVHILKDWSDRFTPGLVNQERYLEKALRWFDAEGADAVMFPGDMCHGGRVSELRAFAAVWDKVFPGGKGSDGRRVERLAVTGNHEIGQWGGLWDGISDEELRRVRLDYDLAHLKANWKRVMGEEFAPVWKREVKGISFIGVHYSALNPDIGGFFRAHAAELDPNKPFFVFQHRSPAFTCQGRGYGPEEAQLTKLLSPHPNAVAITGHTHYSLADNRNVWQGAFTAIDAGCACAAEPSYADMTFENGGASYTWEYRKQRMRCLSQCGNEGRGCIMVTVYADRLEIQRRSLEFDEPLGPDWRVPLPAAPGGPFDYGVCARKLPAPQFAAGAKVAIEICKTDPENVGPGLKGKPCLRITFPYAGAVEGSRTFAYDVQAFAGGREVFASRVLSYGYHLPERRSHVPGECILALADLPKDEDIVFAIRPLGVYRQPGAAILSAPIRL